MKLQIYSICEKLLIKHIVCICITNVILMSKAHSERLLCVQKLFPIGYYKCVLYSLNIKIYYNINTHIITIYMYINHIRTYFTLHIAY